MKKSKQLKNIYYVVCCEECSREYEFMEYSQIPVSMVCHCGATVLTPAILAGFGNYGIFSSFKSRVGECIRYNLNRLMDKIWE